MRWLEQSLKPGLLLRLEPNNRVRDKQDSTIVLRRANDRADGTVERESRKCGARLGTP